MLRRAVFIIAVLLISVVAHAKNLTLTRAWINLLKYDPDLKAQQQAINESLGAKTESISVFLPQVHGDIHVRRFQKEFGWIMGAMPQFGITTPISFPATDQTVPKYSVELNQLVFDSGSSIAFYKSAVRNVRAANSFVFAKKQDRAVRLTSVYSDHYLSLRNFEVAKKVADSWTEHERVARLRYRQQLVPKTDVLYAEVKASNSRLKVISAKDAIDVTKMKLESMIGTFEGGMSAPVVPLPPDKTPDPTLRPEVIAKEQEAESARLRAKGEGLAYLPKLYGNIAVSYTDNSYLLNKDQYRFIGGVRIPVFDGKRHWGKRKIAKARQSRFSYEKQALIESYKVEADNVLRAWNRSKLEISVAEKNRVTASENLRITRDRYKMGLAPSSDVRDAVVLWSRAEYKYHKAICDRQVIAASLRRAISVPVFESEVKK